MDLVPVMSVFVQVALAQMGSLDILQQTASSAHGNLPYCVPCSLHNEKIPIPSAIILSEFIQRIPVVAYVVGDAYPAMPSVIFQPASNSRRTLQLTLRIGFE